MGTRTVSQSYAIVTMLLAGAWAPLTPVAAAPRTACTITINSPDEREIFRRHLPEDQWRVVELVERGTPDWLEGACRKGITCDVLVISGHFDGGVEFYSDRLDQRESLPMRQLERVACSQACPGLFAQLKEVYLFGCNTLNAEGTTSLGAEVEQWLVRSGLRAREASLAATSLNQRHARSNRDRMRLLFKDVPVLYGFAAKAPLGHVAGPLLEKHLVSEAGRDVGSGRMNASLVKRFAAASMTTASGASDDDPLAGFRRDVCALHDQRAPLGRRAIALHDILRRDIGEVRMLLEPVEQFVAELDAHARGRPEVLDVFATIRNDVAARERFLGYARHTGDSATRVRMIDAGWALGWLSAEERDAELLALLADRLAEKPGAADVDLACRLNQDGALGKVRGRLDSDMPRATGRAAMLACLGDMDARSSVIDTVTSGPDADVELAQVLLHHRPLADRQEFHRIAARLNRVTSADVLARALGILSRQPLVDEVTYALLARLFPASRSLAVQRAIADILVRADYRGPDRAELVRMLREHRVLAGERDVIDVLIRRLAL